MRHLSLLLLIPALAFSANEKLTPEQRIELIRGLSSEYATVKLMLPRSKSALEYEIGGKFNRDKWDEAAKERGPAARPGDLIQITNVEIDDKQITFQINGGLKSGRKWYDGVSVGTGTRGVPMGNASGTPTLGTAIVVKFPTGVPPVDTPEMKKLLKSLFDFEKRTSTESYVDSLPPEIKAAVKENRVIEGMDKDQVILAMGKPRLKSRETNEGVETEDWVYGNAPGKITFLTFQSNKVTKIRESFAGLGGQTVQGPRPVTP
jgi:hypothetical protein